MYDNLILRLRNCATQAAPCKACDMIEDDSCIDTLMKQAADAIESTSKAYQMISEAYEAEVTKQVWVPVTERLPEENGHYLTYVESAIFPNSYYLNMIKFIDGNFIEDHCVIHRVTHWMQLPEPPESEDE